MRVKTMAEKTVPAAAHEWQGMANDVLGANLVGNLCGKKTQKQAYRWARLPGVEEAQNGPLAHVLALCLKLHEARRPDLAVAALKLIAGELFAAGLPVRAYLEPGPGVVTVPTACADLQRAASDLVEAARSGKPPMLVTMHADLVKRNADVLDMSYVCAWDKEDVTRFRAKAPAEEALPSGGGFWRAVWRGIVKAVRG
ncbi:hypothetical protein [Salidesulfovibrio brasiliensis]|uniref:hypothetical protein n=1 Tax=Salidesulfovibrio brasiliensis TaxID=221711 RepID=UPI0012EDBB28|nr:hypothetical protein [Salidesulfovibrio brasiliensis]